jgi:hypothetical protein
LAALILFVGLAVHPSLIILAVGLLLSLIATLIRFEKRNPRHE